MSTARILCGIVAGSAALLVGVTVQEASGALADLTGDKATFGQQTLLAPGELQEAISVNPHGKRAPHVYSGPRL